MPKTAAEQLISRVLRLDLLAAYPRDRVVRRDRRLAEPDRDERDLPVVARDVARGVDSGKRRLHRLRLDEDLPLAVELEPPVGDRPEMGVEAEQRDERLAGDLLRLAGGGVLEDDA